MKRSKINAEIRHMEEMIKAHGFEIPPFCKWTAKDWESKGAQYDEIRDNMLGWDITDYGLGKFDEVGFSLITIRNGNLKMDKYTKTYAEKLLLVKEGQMAPMHFHWNKMEDIINRGGGNVLITVYNSTKDGEFADTDVTVNCDGREFTVPMSTTTVSMSRLGGFRRLRRTKSLTGCSATSTRRRRNRKDKEEDKDDSADIKGKLADETGGR